MKSWTLVIGLVILTSCNSSTNRDLKNEQRDSSASAIIYDSLKIAYGRYVKFDKSMNATTLLTTECRKDQPLDHTQSNQALGDLGRNDTLKLYAEFVDCGEFGGNREYINVFRKDSILECTLIQDSVVCNFDEYGRKYFRKAQQTLPLSESASQSITDYLELLLRYSLKGSELHSHAAGYFSATITRGVDYRKDFSFDVYDSEGQWIYFDILKNEIKTSANI
ncbi:hypothetical protein GXP67_02180 [Rhodocytophaga rosea]|uniref:Lipoprotein n=1 Tax=Rhodocytophaga rosea TaxID=2704465 RepID=A0A6C0GCH7_9BACT|nr:hypothetical protein [Rhodocytophaga rosea]QHT65554.1 hypothetical protein GXP67_02180 [Rhodocytophaga rosea]